VSGPREHRFGAHAGLLWLPDGAMSFLALAHRAGAGMRHAFLEAIAGALARCRVTTLRFEFPYGGERILGNLWTPRPATCKDASGCGRREASEIGAAS
jgi:predicted alpha/beta-hydrolase family hydrolase